MATVALENVHKVYQPGIEAVKNVSLNIEDGEFVVLVGPSGCGKTTILRMIAGLEAVSSGSIKIGEIEVNHISAKDRDIAMVFQSYALYPHMTALENIVFPLKRRNLPKQEIQKRVQWVIETLGLSEFLNRKPKELSGGQRQRVAVGRAIVRHPKVFLFDEPLSSLDAILRVEMRILLKRLHRELKTTTVYVTHDQEEAMTLGERVAVMCRGIIYQDGPPLKVYKSPRNRFVAGFFGMPPMNLLKGTLLVNDGALFFKGATFMLKLPPHYGERLTRYVDQHVVLGIPPEAGFLCHELHGSSESTIHVVIVMADVLGDQMNLYVHTEANEPMVFRLPPKELKLGDSDRVQIQSDKVHIFEGSEFGSNLTLAHSKDSSSL